MLSGSCGVYWMMAAVTEGGDTLPWSMSGVILLLVWVCSEFHLSHLCSFLLDHLVLYICLFVFLLCVHRILLL